MSAVTMLLAWAIEVAVGWPDAVYARIRHPVVWIGSLISGLDRALNRESLSPLLRGLFGGLTTLLIAGATCAIAILIAQSTRAPLLEIAIAAVIGSSLLASRSLHEHVDAVRVALSTGNLSEAREAVSHIVGRDTRQLDEAGIARAAIESLAENASDGVIAPLFWGVLLGLPGLATYKAINTLDSMIGHRSARYEYFGKFAARADDVANWIPARLTGALFVLAANARPKAWRVMWRDSRHHRSVNAGWPEAAMAGALSIRLSGPRQYAAATTTEPWINDGAMDPDATMIASGLGVYLRAMLIGAFLLAFIAGVQVML